VGVPLQAGGGDELVRHDEIRNRVRINALGWHDTAGIGVGEGALRVVALGDSFTAGLEVSTGETYPHRLAALLAERTQAAVRVWNLGLDGTGTDLQRRIFEEVGLEKRPDLVVVQMFRNDFRETGRPMEYREVHAGCVLSYETEAQREELRRQAEAMGGLLDALAHVSYLARGVRVAVRGVPSNFLLSRPEAETGKHASLDERTAMVLEEVLRIRDLAAEQGAPLVVVFAPAKWKVVDAEPGYVSYPMRRIGDALAAEGIPVLDLTERLLAGDEAPARIFWEHDSHPNAEGYRWMGVEVGEWLLREGLAPPPP
jgi:lysophospholipase L1-like esterase